MGDKECPAEPVVGDQDRQGGFAKTAEHLNELFPNRRRPISRQLVHKWWLYRHLNGFPASKDTSGTVNGGKGRPIFDFDAVDTWYRQSISYRRHYGAYGNQPPARESGTKPITDDGDTLAA
jgi:hypothetical protein